MPLRTAFLAGALCVVMQGAEQRGTVRSAGLPIPGATVTARNADRKLTASTNESGVYVFSDLPSGDWTVEVEMMGFAPASRQVQTGTVVSALDLDLRMEQPRRVAQVAAPQNAGQRPGFRRLEVTQAAAQTELQAALNSPPSEPPSDSLSQNANESFLVNGSLSQGLQSPQRMDDAFAAQAEMRGGLDGMPGERRGGPGGNGPGGGNPFGGGGPGGGFGGRGGGGPGGGGGFGGRGGPGGGGFDRRGPRGPGAPRGATTFGNRSRRGREGFHGGASFSLRNSAVDAKPYSIGGGDISKASYAQSRISLMAGGALRIPKLLTDDKTFLFVNYFATRSRNPFDAVATVPTALERNGDFSQSAARGASAIFDPLTSQPFSDNRIPASRIDPSARALLNLIPAPNQPGQLQNFQLITSVPQNTDNLGLRANRTLTAKDRLSGSFNLQRRNAINAQLFGYRDTSTGLGINTDITWTHNVTTGLINNLRVSFSRNGSELLPYFAFGTDWARQAGIAGTSDDPRNYGPPNLSFTNFGALNDGSPSKQHTQTAGISEGIIRTKGQHTVSLGIEYRRLQTNSITDQNGRGSYAFSGLLTSGFDANGLPLAGTGFDFADYLLGLPQSSSIRFGSSDLYFRSSALNAYLQDDWRVRSNLTINAGLRYEFLTPIHEKYGRMANLDIAPGFAAVAVVTPDIAGPYTGQYPGGLVNSDPNNLAPRVGISWKPIPKKQTLVRAGYGWYYNSSIYNSAASRLAQQPPFAKTYSVTTSLANPLTIENGFLGVISKQITNTFAIDRNYLVGYAQTWNVAVQQELPWSIVAEAGYVGTKGTRLDIQRLPNRAAPGSPLTSEQRRLIGNATGFIYDTSDGNSIYHAGQLRVTRRFRRGISLNALYTLSKSIDNASTIGGGGAVVVQDDRNLAAERGLSSFDRTHNLNLSFLLSTSGSPASALARNRYLRDWQFSGGFVAQSGLPFTAIVLGNRSDVGGTGAVGSARANATGLPVEGGASFFDLRAFSVPAAGQYGNAGRNTIRGPSIFTANLSFGRTLRFGDTRRSMDVRAEANNLLNNVNITSIGTTVNSSYYGVPLSAGSMRTLNLNLRFRF